MEQSPPRAAAYVLASAFMFALTGATVKAASAHLPFTVVVFFRSALGLAALTPWLLRGGLRGLATERPGLHLVRGLTGLGAMYCYFFALGHLDLAAAVLLNYSAPLFIPIIAALWLGERIAPTILWATPLGFLGIALILRPGWDLLGPAAVAGVAAGILAAFSFVTIRRLHDSEPTTRIVFYFGVTSVVISALPLPFTWQEPEPAQWGLLVAMGASATGGQLLLTRGYALAPAHQVGPFTYTVVVFAVLLGWGLWGEVPGQWFALGALLVVLAGILAIQARQAPPSPRQ